MATKKTATKAPVKKAAPKKAATKKTITVDTVSIPKTEKATPKPVETTSGPFLEIVSNTTGETVHIPLNGDVLENVLGAITRDVIARTEKASISNSEHSTISNNVFEGGHGTITTAPIADTQSTRTSTLLSRTRDLQEQLVTTSYLVNGLITISNRFFGENNGATEDPKLSSGDENIIGQFDELLKYQRLYNSIFSETVERLNNFI